MIVQKTEAFDRWFNALKDEAGKAHIARRLRRVETENFFGDCERLKGSDLYELRIQYGPGYRVYFKKHNENTIVLVLRGGTKKTQSMDIKKSKKQAQEK